MDDEKVTDDECIAIWRAIRPIIETRHWTHRKVVAALEIIAAGILRDGAERQMVAASPDN